MGENKKGPTGIPVGLQMAVCYLGVGSNLGNRKKNITSAVKKINALKDTKVIKVSRIIKTRAVGGPKGQPEFLNAALKIKTGLPPAALLKKLKEIERGLGRTEAARWGPRTIDLDILLYGTRSIDKKGLKIPHPRMFGRKFVIEPLLEII